MTDPIPFWLADQEFDPAVPVEKLSEHPENPNQGDLEAIADSLDHNGFYGAVVAQKSTGVVVAGNHRLRVAKRKGAKTLPAFLLDIDDGQARRILAIDNRTTHLATFEEEKLIALLTTLGDEPAGLSGTGYTSDDLADLITAWKPPELEELAGQHEPGEDDLWPVLRFKVPPETRDRFYAVTDASDDKTDEGRFLWLIRERELL